MAPFATQQEQPCFASNASTLDESELSEDAVFALEQRQVVPSSRKLRVIFGSLVVAGLLVAAAALKFGSVGAADLAAVQVEAEEKGIAPFKQCGGATWTKGTCCRSGCACIQQSRFYSLCQTPGGGQTCNLQKAQSEVQSAEEKKVLAGPKAVDAFHTAKAAIVRAKEAKAEEVKAQEAYEKARAEGATVKHAKEHTEAIVLAAKKAAAAAKKAADDSLTEYGKVKEEAEGLNKTAALRKHGQCSVIFKSCGPISPPRLNEYQACCQEGCICVWQQYYAQCKAPPGMSACDPAGEKAHVTERMSTMAKLQQQHEDLFSQEKAAKEKYLTLDNKADTIRHKAAVAGTKHFKAKALLNKRKAITRELTHNARKLIAAAKHMKNEVRYCAEGIKAWKAAAAGLKCGEKPPEDELSEAEKLDHSELENHGLDKDEEDNEDEEEEKPEEEEETKEVKEPKKEKKAKEVKEPKEEKKAKEVKEPKEEMEKKAKEEEERSSERRQEAEEVSV